MSGYTEYPGLSAFKQVGLGGGRAPVAGDLALSAGWGDSASVGSILGSEGGFSFVVTSAGSGQGASPTITYTYPTTFKTAAGAVAAPRAIVVRNTRSSQATIECTWVPGTTSLVITLGGTPVAAETFGFTVLLFA